VFSSPPLSTVYLHIAMVKYTPLFKDQVLREYCPGNRGQSFRFLARRFGIKGGESVVRTWYHRWKGNPQSLERKPGSGGRYVLTPKEVEHYILRPLERRNQKHQPVHYTELKGPVERAVGHPVSVRAIQRRGKEEAGCRSHSTVPRTVQERTTSTYNPQPRRSSPC
jgi:transposase-like protein